MFAGLNLNVQIKVSKIVGRLEFAEFLPAYYLRKQIFTLWLGWSQQDFSIQYRGQYFSYQEVLRE